MRTAAPVVRISPVAPVPWGMYVVGRTAFTAGDGGFEELDGLFIGGSADVAGADVVVIGRRRRSGFAIDVDAGWPIVLPEGDPVVVASSQVVQGQESGIC